MRTYTVFWRPRYENEARIDYAEVPDHVPTSLTFIMHYASLAYVREVKAVPKYNIERDGYYVIAVFKGRIEPMRFHF